MLQDRFLITLALQMETEPPFRTFILVGFILVTTRGGYQTVHQRMTLIGLTPLSSYSSQGLHYRYFELGKNTDPEKESDPRFDAAFTVHPVLDPVQIYRLHRYFARVELERTYQEIRQLQVRTVRCSMGREYGLMSLAELRGLF